MESDLEEIASRQGMEEVPEVAGALAAAIDRGHHLAIAAADGSGKEVVFAAAADRALDPESTSLQAVVLTPTRDAAVRIATALWRALAERGLRIRAIAEAEASGAATPPHCLVGRPSDLLPAVRSGHVGLDDLRLLVLDGVADLEELDEWTSTEPILDTLPPEVQKIAVTRKPGGEFESLLTRQLPRARRWPEELFGTPGGEAATRTEPAASRALGCGAAASAAERLKLLEACVRRAAAGGETRITCFGSPAAAEVLAFLAARGLPVTGSEGRELCVGKASDSDSAEPAAARTAVVFGLPLGLAALRSACERGATAFAIVDAAHVSQLELMARRAGWALKPFGAVPYSDELDPVTRYRQRVRTQIERQDSDAELLVLDPLLREHGALRVAAALSALLRGRCEGAEPAAAWPDVEAASMEVTGAREPARHRGARPAWSRIFVGAGKRDDIRPGDLVGAITGEAGVAGAQIGKIDIRNGFSLVEIDSQVVDDVIRALQGTSIRGRLVPVRLDRESRR